jgi:hypothetical protein
MTVEEATQRLASLAIEIEKANTTIWLLEREREKVRTELRRALHASPRVAPQPSAEAPAAPTTYSAVQPLLGQLNPQLEPPPLAPRRTVY